MPKYHFLIELLRQVFVYGRTYLLTLTQLTLQIYGCWLILDSLIIFKECTNFGLKRKEFGLGAGGATAREAKPKDKVCGGYDIHRYPQWASILLQGLNRHSV